MYNYSSVHGVSYERLQEIFDEMFNAGFVCDEDTMVQFIRDNRYLKQLSRKEVTECVHQFIEDTYNG